MMDCPDWPRFERVRSPPRTGALRPSRPKWRRSCTTSAVSRRSRTLRSPTGRSFGPTMTGPNQRPPLRLSPSRCPSPSLSIAPSGLQVACDRRRQAGLDTRAHRGCGGASQGQAHVGGLEGRPGDAGLDQEACGGPVRAVPRQEGDQANAKDQALQGRHPDDEALVRCLTAASKSYSATTQRFMPSCHRELHRSHGENKNAPSGSFEKNVIGNVCQVQPHQVAVLARRRRPDGDPLHHDRGALPCPLLQNTHQHTRAPPPPAAALVCVCVEVLLC